MATKAKYRITIAPDVSVFDLYFESQPEAYTWAIKKAMALGKHALVLNVTKICKGEDDE